MPNARNIRLSSDIGGTFTDIVLDNDGVRTTSKVLTTPMRPEQAVLEGAGAILGRAGLSMGDVDVFVHGTTLATNAIIERRGAKTALLATGGFRDILEIGTESRFDQYDLMLEKPAHLVPRDLRFTVAERMEASGRVYTVLDEAAMAGIAARLATLDVASLAIAFLHAYKNPAHELRAGEIVRQVAPGVTVTLSHEVCPEVREYERTSTAVANAYVQPLIDGYLGRMEAALTAAQFRGAVYLVTSGGGLTSIETARRFPVRLVESGPAGGAIFAAQVASRSRSDRVLSFDMGGTTAKVCLIRDGRPETSRFFEVDRTARFLKGSGLPLRIPVIEMVEIGAGGGSIARVDALKRVAIGPESASSVPGPACYGRGGERATVTDADFVLGLLEPSAFAGGTMQIDEARAARALSDDVGEPLGLSAEMSAFAVYEMVCETMSSAARVHAAESGVVIGQHTMIAFGGAAPLHAARVAEKVGITKVIVPPNAGVGSAVGFLAAPISFEVVRSQHALLTSRFDTDGVTALLQDMAAGAHALVVPGAGKAPLFERRSAFMRYVGQGHEIAVVLPNRPLGAHDVPGLRDSFETAYAEQFSRSIPGAEIEVLNWSVLVSTYPAQLAQPDTIPARCRIDPPQLRAVFDSRINARRDIGLYRRSEIALGSIITGPAIIVEEETTTYVTGSFDAFIDGAGCIVMEKKVP